MICAFTGHRPQRLPWGGREDDPRCQALKILLGSAVAEAVARGCDTFLCGMALGCDTYFAEAVLEKKQTDPSLRLVAMLPCPEQASRWPERDRRRYEALLARCDETRVLEPSYSEGCMLRRNYAMVQEAQLLISVFDGRPGGTASTVHYAEKQGVEILSVWM